MKYKNHRKILMDKIKKLEDANPNIRFDVHHLDHDTSNNDPLNLIIVPSDMHRIYHNNIDKNKYIKAGKSMRGQSRRKGIFKDFPNANYSSSLKRFPRCFRSTIYFNGYQKSLGVYEDPLSASIVAKLVNKEISNV